MKLVIDGKAYPWAGIHKVPLIHRIKIQKEMGVGPNEMMQMLRESAALDEKYRADCEIAEKEGKPLPDAPIMDPFIEGLMVWAARLSAGEKLSFEEACDVVEYKFEAEPGDEGYVAPGETPEQPDPTQDAVKPKGSSAKSKRPVEAVA